MGEKDRKSFLAGSSTGPWLLRERWKNDPRPKLCLLSKQYPSFLDASLATIEFADLPVALEMVDANLLGKFVPWQQQLAYKYLISIDGVTCAYEGTFWPLLSNSLLFKQESSHKQWYYKGLKPWIHYVPFANDCSDLIEKITWAKEHDREAKEIAEEGSRFAKTISRLKKTLPM